MVLRRVASAAVLIPLVVWLTIGGPAWLCHGLVIALAAATAWELGRMFERAGRATHRWLDSVLAALVTASFVVSGGTVAALTVAVLIALAVPVWRGTSPSTDASTVTLLAVTYCGWLLGHAILVRELPGGGALVLLLLGITWAGDSAAYFVGSTLGRHKLAPVVSPNKTIEGSVAQVIATVIAAIILRPWLAPGWSPAFAVVVGALIGVIGQIGDLAESVIKRTLGTKDTGGLIPGHGGLLDRLDSLLFNFPAFYYLVTVGGRA
jgi:phosphatidate cytidylyltransferase